MNDVVVIFANQRDVHAVAVAAEILKTRKADPVILDTADYPAKWSLTQAFDPRDQPGWTINVAGWTTAPDQITGLWWRRPRRHVIPKAVEDRKVRSFCLDESVAALRGWLHGLGDLVVNPIALDTAAGRKPLQLLKAREAGLSIPRTLISNDPKEAREFVDALDGRAIFKVLTGTTWQFTETRRFRKGYARHLRKLRYAPAIFQELIEGQLDIRVTIVDDAIFPVSIRATHPGARVDWRLDLAADIARHPLPPELEQKLHRLMALLGLRYGAVDLKLTPDGEYVFLEINPGGQFLFCEIHAGVPISQALAAALLDRRPRPPPH